MDTKSKKQRSASDSSFNIFIKEKLELVGFSSNGVSWTESDTRSKLIDKIFKDILGWSELDIRREEPSGGGFADYLIGVEKHYFHIEAKRLIPRIDFKISSKDRYLQLNGPHLLGNKEVRPYIEQAAKYSLDLGTRFSVVTNGEQIVIFRNYIEGRKWKEGNAIVFYGYDDIQSDFAFFYKLLSADTVRNGSLPEAFEEADGISLSLYSPIEYIYNPNAELIRNPFWNKISSVVGPVLSSDPMDLETQEKIIEHCYVPTSLSDEVDREINKLLQDKLTKNLEEAGTVDIKPTVGGNDAFKNIIESDIKARYAGTYILTGGVGSGKTTFLKRFARFTYLGLVRQYCIWIHIDFLPIGNIESDKIDEELKRYTYKSIRDSIKALHGELWPNDGEKIRSLFSKKITELEVTLLYNVERGSAKWNEKINEIVHECFSNDEETSEAILSKSIQLGLRPVIVLDNTDQLGEKFQESVFLLSQKLSKKCSALTIVALREEKFFAAYRRGAFDAYGNKKFHIGSPNLKDVVRKRLEYSLELFKGNTHQQEEDNIQIVKFIELVISSTTKNNYNITRYLSCVSNGDMRYALDIFRDFISSGNTNVPKILDILKETDSYTIPFHEFAKSAILGSRKFYKTDSSRVINLFIRTASSYSSHLTALRVLSRLSAIESTQSRYGEGFIETRKLLEEYRDAFGRADDLLQKGEELLRRGLIESEPPKANSIELTDALKISASGAYYWKFLVRSFIYLDLVLVDTPLKSKELSHFFANKSSSNEIFTREERVGKFIEYLSNEESAETKNVIYDNFYKTSLINGIKVKVESEIKMVKSKIAKNSKFDIF